MNRVFPSSCKSHQTHVRSSRSRALGRDVTAVYPYDSSSTVKSGSSTTTSTSTSTTSGYRQVRKWKGSTPPPNYLRVDSGHLVAPSSIPWDKRGRRYLPNRQFSHLLGDSITKRHRIYLFAAPSLYRRTHHHSRRPNYRVCDIEYLKKPTFRGCGSWRDPSTSVLGVAGVRWWWTALGGSSIALVAAS